MLLEHVGDLLIGDGEVVLPMGIVGVGLGEPLADGEASAVGLKCLGEIALPHKRIAQPVIRDGKLGLPAGIVGIGLCQPLANGKPFAVDSQRLGELAVRHQRVA